MGADSKGKYQPWYHESFMSDPRVRKMSPTAAKTYMMLLHEAFVCSTRPNLLDDEEELELLAYCSSHEEWVLVRDSVLKMFTKQEIDGQMVLTNKRLTKDWERLQEIREARSEAGKASAAKRKSANVEHLLTNEHKEVSKQVNEEKEVEVSEEEIMKIQTEAKAVCEAFGVTPGGYKSDWDQMAILARTYKTGAVLNDLKEYLDEYRGDDFPRGAIPRYLGVASARLAQDSAPAAATLKDPEVVSLARELSYLSGGSVAFQDKQKIRLAETLKEFTAEEITAVFKTWVDEQDLIDPKNLSFLPGKFVQIAGDKAYALRKSREVRSKDAVERELAVKRLQEEAEANRAAAEAVKAEEENLFDPLAG